jgi:tetratricopeptide (TPR) repeat protein
VVCLLACALIFAAAPALDEEIERATQLLERGALAEAKALLAELEALAPHDRQLRFLKAHVALREGERKRAIEIFRGLLSEDPSLVRVRLDLARTLYEKGEFEAATYHFEVALGADIPEVVRRNVQAYLDRMRHAKTYVSLHVGAAHDSNPNQAPRTNTIYLFGLPFELGDGAQPKRSWALVINAVGRLALGADKRSYLLAALDTREYSDAVLNYRVAQVGVGHSAPLEGWRLGAEGGWQVSHFQKRTLSEGPWARIYAWGKLGTNVLLSPSLQRRWNDYPTYGYLSGTQDNAALDATVAAAPSLAFVPGIGYGRTSAADPVYSFRSVELRFGVRTELPLGLILGARFASAESKYDAEDLLFQASRRDRQRRVELEVGLRALSFRGVAPVLFWSRIRNDSNIALYAWDRRVAGIGLTTRF